MYVEEMTTLQKQYSLFETKQLCYLLTPLYLNMELYKIARQLQLHKDQTWMKN